MNSSEMNAIIVAHPEIREVVLTPDAYDAFTVGLFTSGVEPLDPRQFPVQFFSGITVRRGAE
jgi:hypothetical protein